MESRVTPVYCTPTSLSGLGFVQYKVRRLRNSCLIHISTSPFSLSSSYNIILTCFSILTSLSLHFLSQVGIGYKSR